MKSDNKSDNKAKTSNKAPVQEREEREEFDPEDYKLIAGPWDVLEGIQVAVRQYADNPAKVRIEKVKKNGDIRPMRGGLTAAQAAALAPVLLQAAEALNKAK